MSMLSRVAITLCGALVGMTGAAAAQPKPAEPKPATPKPAEPKPADTKPAGGAMEMKPPAEVTEMAKAVAGTWRCKGQGMDHTQKMVDASGTMKLRADLNGWWIHGTFESKMGKEPFVFEQYTTFDPAAKKWKRIMVESGGAWNSGESAGPINNKTDWDFVTHSPMMGDGMFRDHEDLSDPKAGAKMWGEYSPDKGKTWVKVYELTCKK